MYTACPAYQGTRSASRPFPVSPIATHHERKLAVLGRDLGRDPADQPLLVVDEEREARRAALLDFLLARDDHVAVVQPLPDEVCRGAMSETGSV